VRLRLIFTFAIAGLVVALPWTFLETQLIAWLPQASSSVVWRLTQALVGFTTAVILVGPLVLIARPNSPKYGVIFVAAFLAFEIVATEPASDLASLFQLPDTWVFLATSVALIWVAATRNAPRSAA
jgi:hypothetical protein